MKKYLNYIVLIFLIFSFSCQKYQIKKDTISKVSKIQPVNFDGKYHAVFDKRVSDSGTKYWLKGFYVESSQKTTPLLLAVRHMTDNCTDLAKMINPEETTRIETNELHPKISPGVLFENKSTYENDETVVVSFNVKGKGNYVSKICDQFYTTYNAGNCNDISQEDTFFVFTSIESSTPLTEREIIDKGLKPLSKKGFEYGTCH